MGCGKDGTQGHLGDARRVVLGCDPSIHYNHLVPRDLYWGGGRVCDLVGLPFLPLLLLLLPHTFVVVQSGGIVVVTVAVENLCEKTDGC